MNKTIFEKSAEMGEELAEYFTLGLYDDSKRIITSGVACSMSLEHWTATLTMLELGLLPSAAVVHRSQFEALLRSVWLLYAASEEQLNKLSEKLTLVTEQGAKNLPQTADMMTALSKTGPVEAYAALNRFKENSWKALNSYAHAGIHPLSRHAEGYPVQLIADLVRNANGLAVMAAMQAVVLSGDQPLQKEVLGVASRHLDCMPPPL
ncbi:DUF6988 family protein [Pseudomonas turukhanskensis]|uniref:Uncharacterized protein n=1 Tax=Pseudomonas turukhanskensis TaxID=1806536 RepID=A0A9W6K857_9PSED|nr:hypothetical protein [Pseudomonas turukhanskensis]GLK90006.1 hypothetical protein GCM10017655_30680 [Pseudomonas turukhanskensis]